MAKKDNLAAFKRIWSYVWPQWPRVITVVFWSFLIAIMFAVSFMTILPLLKVMMNEEGLHGWVDRKTIEWRYGLDIAIPNPIGQSVEEQYALTIVGIEEESLSEGGGFLKLDRIVGVNNASGEKVEYSDLLDQLATAEISESKSSITIYYTRFDDGQLKQFKIEMPIATQELATGEKFLKRLDWWRKWTASELSQWVIKYLPEDKDGFDKTRSIIFIIIGMGIVTILRCLARFYQSYLADKIVWISISHIREDVFAHTMRMPIGFFSRQGTSDTTSRIIGDVGQCGKGIKIILGKTLREPLKAMATLTCALGINWQLTLIFIGAAPLTIAAFAVLGRKIKKATKKSLVSNALMLNRIQDAMNALRVVKVYNRQDHEIEQYHRTNRTLLKRLLRVSKIERMTNPLMEVLGMVAASAALIMGAIWMGKNQIEGSEFLTLLVMLGTSAESLRKVSDVWNHVQSANAAAERVFEVVDEPREPEEPDAAELPPLRECIRFEDIVFTYPGAESPALNNLNLTVKAGQTVAVVGPNGSGKSTLVNLIPRFYDPDSGQIFIDGHDIHQATLYSLRDQISMVTQNVITFNDTVANNIAYGKPGATMEEIIEAAKQAYAHEFIEPLSEGYETIIGENSAGFSGGQLQRMVIARAILKNPPIMIFDEAMSQIDADSEMKIHNALSVLMKGRTCFLIAHRFSTVISADSIAVVDDGRIVAQGAHDELIQSCELYKRLYETQLMGG